MPNAATHVAERTHASKKLLHLLGAYDADDAYRLAEHELAGARHCPCCKTLLAHLTDRLGSVLFADDDPDRLAALFSPEERDEFTPRLLAACILLYGRPRVELFGAG